MRPRSAVPLLCAILCSCVAPSRAGIEAPVAAPVAVPVGADACGPAAAVDTRAWRMVRMGPFSFRLPPGFGEGEDRSIDSVVRQWNAAGGRAVDLGTTACTPAHSSADRPA